MQMYAVDGNDHWSLGNPYICQSMLYDIMVENTSKYKWQQQQQELEKTHELMYVQAVDAERGICGLARVYVQVIVKCVRGGRLGGRLAGSRGVFVLVYLLCQSCPGGGAVSGKTPSCPAHGAVHLLQRATKSNSSKHHQHTTSNTGVLCNRGG
jgi:hypothetical protein